MQREMFWGGARGSAPRKLTEKQVAMMEPGQTFARARATDPWTSHAAARDLEASGRGSLQREAVLALVGAHPGETSAEIGSRAAPTHEVLMDRWLAARRLPELERAGLIRRGAVRECSQVRRPCLTWWPT